MPGACALVQAVKRLILPAGARSRGGAATAPLRGASAKEQWEFYAGTDAKPGPWADILCTLNGGRGLTALSDPRTGTGLMSFIGLESIKQIAVDFVQSAVEHRRHKLAGSGDGGRLNYIFIGNPGTGKVRR